MYNSLFLLFKNPVMLIQIFLFLGKSYLLNCIARYATENGYNVCVAAPTSKLALRYAKDLPDCRCNTVYTNFHIPVGTNKSSYNTINWGLSDVHIIIVDEVFMFFFND